MKIFSIQIERRSFCGVNRNKKSPTKYFDFPIDGFSRWILNKLLDKNLFEKSFLLTKNIFVQRTRIHKSLSYHREAGIGCHLNVII